MASTVAPSIMSAVTESGSMPVTARLASSRYTPQQTPAERASSSADAGGGARGAGEDDDAHAGQHDPQPVELVPRAEDGHAQRPDELDGHDDAHRDAADRAVEAEVHQEEGHRERRERQAVTLGRQPPERARPRR